MLRVYLAGDSSFQAQLREIRDILEKRGITVTSFWLDEDLTREIRLSDADFCELAYRDLAAVEQSHVFVFYNPIEGHRKGTGGRHVEFGYACAKGMPIIYIGEKMENIFHRLALVRARIFPNSHIGLEALADAIGDKLMEMFQYQPIEPSER